MMAAIVRSRPPAILRTLNRMMNPLMKRLLRSPLHFVVSKVFLLITFTGRKSGRVYSTPVQYAQQGDTVYVISSVGYTWWKNLRSGADVEVHLRGEPYAAYAETSTDPEVISRLLGTIYPGLSAERRVAFAPGKVAITIRLRD